MFGGIPWWNRPAAADDDQEIPEPTAGAVRQAECPGCGPRSRQHARVLTDDRARVLSWECECGEIIQSLLPPRFVA